MEWKSFIIPFGKYKGDTMYVIYVNDFDYIKWLDSCQLTDEVRGAVDAAIEHKNKTDPWLN
jgi:hypothetical protein